MSDPAPTARRITEVAVGAPGPGPGSGLVLDVDDQGPLDEDVVVLLHGFPERATSWDRVAPLLHAAGLRTLAVDQRGYSPRARPTRRRDFRADLLRDDVVAVLEAARDHARPGTRVHLVGHDWGAVVAWLVAAARPDLVATLTAFSVPHPGAYLRAGLRSRQLLRSWYIAAFNVPGLVERLAARPGGRVDRLLAATGMTRAELATFRAEVVDDGALPGALGWYRALPLSAGAMGASRVRVPTTFVWSDGDTAIDRWGAEHCGEFVRAEYELVVLTGVTHWIPGQAPAAAAEVVVQRVLGSPGPAGGAAS